MKVIDALERAAGSAGACLRAADRIIRIHFLFFSSVWPLLGAASVSPSLSSGQIVRLLAVTFCFHACTYLVNDVVDLPIDRTDPRRKDDLIVRGTILPWQAILAASLLPLLTIPLTMTLGGAWPAHVTLASGFVAITVYNVWGKSCPWPPVTDAIQGMAWGSLAVYAPYALGAEPNALTWLVGSYVAVFTLLFNGIHGPLRDLVNDFAGGAKTTAIFLGARPASGRRPARVPFAVSLYAWCALMLVVALSTVIMLRNDFSYGAAAWTAITAVVGIINLFIVILQFNVVYPAARTWDVSYRLQLYLVTIAPVVAFAAHLNVETWVAMLLLTAISLPFFGWTGRVARSAWTAIWSGVPVYGKRFVVRPQ